MLSINPTHAKGASGNIIPLNLPDDNNSGSLVVKLQIREHSAILSGDATGTTTARIIDNYSKVDPLFLKSSVEESSHHGAFTHKSNSKAWIKSREPTYVVFSSGSLHGHPAEKAYKNYAKIYDKNEKTKNLVVKPHDVCLWRPITKKSKEKETPVEKYEGVQRKTRKPFFSTFNSGSMTIMMPLKKKIGVESELRGPEKLEEWRSKKKRPHDKVTPLSLDEQKLEEFAKEEEGEESLSERPSTISQKRAKNLESSFSPYSPKNIGRKTKDEEEKEGKEVKASKKQPEAPKRSAVKRKYEGAAPTLVRKKVRSSDEKKFEASVIKNKKQEDIQQALAASIKEKKKKQKKVPTPRKKLFNLRKHL
jgi:hypothetical protein